MNEVYKWFLSALVVVGVLLGIGFLGWGFVWINEHEEETSIATLTIVLLAVFSGFTYLAYQALWGVR